MTGHMVIRRLSEGREYRFRVSAENVHGRSEPSLESELVITQEPKIEIDYDKLGEYDDSKIE